MHILIADSGSTKTSWTLIDNNGHRLFDCHTQGINPTLLDDNQILQRLKFIVDALHDVKTLEGASSLHICFYGSGVTAQQQQRMCHLLWQSFDVTCNILQIHSYSDIMAAARATCQDGAGIVAILGTGSNSCLYDGNVVIQQTPSLGYILGDEGGAVYIGKMLINNIYKQQFHTDIRQAFEQYTHETMDSIIEKVYRQPMPNTFIASLTPFISEYRIQFPELNDIINRSFRAFIKHNILPYFHHQYSISDSLSTAVHAIGSIADAFRSEWKEALAQFQLRPGIITKDPIEGLVMYHSDCIK